MAVVQLSARRKYQEPTTLVWTIRHAWWGGPGHRGQGREMVQGEIEDLDVHMVAREDLQLALEAALRWLRALPPLNGHDGPTGP